MKFDLFVIAVCVIILAAFTGCSTTSETFQVTEEVTEKGKVLREISREPVGRGQIQDPRGPEFQQLQEITVLSPPDYDHQAGPRQRVQQPGGPVYIVVDGRQTIRDPYGFRVDSPLSPYNQGRPHPQQQVYQGYRPSPPPPLYYSGGGGRYYRPAPSYRGEGIGAAVNRQYGGVFHPNAWLNSSGRGRRPGQR